MALAFLNRCIWRAASSGTGDFVVASAITGHQIPEDCLNPAVVDGAPYRYFAQSDDKTQWEIGYGTYDEASDTLARTVILDSSNSGSVVTFSAAPSVFMGGPQASDVAFRGFENVTTDNATPVEVSLNVLITYVTTDASGLPQYLEIPTSSNDVGLQHIVVIAAQVDGSDSVIIEGLIDPRNDSGSIEASMFPTGSFLILVNEAVGWKIQHYSTTGIDFNPALSPLLPSITTVVDQGKWLQANAGSGFDLSSYAASLALSFEEVDLSVSSTCSGEVYYSQITTDGSAGAQPSDLDDGEVLGQYKFIEVFLADPADEINFDTTNIENEGGSTPTITFSTNGSLLLQWRPRNKWVVIEGTAGVVS